MVYENRYGQSPKYECLLFDLDDTLYPLSSGLAKAVLRNIQDYMAEKLGIEEGKIPDYCNLLYKHYGTTMAGLRAIGYDFDYDEYHSFVHGRLPYENLKPDPVLRALLLSMPIRKVIFTNADKVHTAKVLSKLGLEDCFEGIICFETLNPIHKNTVSDDEDDIAFTGLSATGTQIATSNPEIFDIIGHFSKPIMGASLPKTPIVCKPSEDCIERALRIANINPQKTVGKSQKIKGADYALESIHNIREAIYELWEDDRKGEVDYPALRAGQVAVETSVTA